MSFHVKMSKTFLPHSLPVGTIVSLCKCTFQTVYLVEIFTMYCLGTYVSKETPDTCVYLELWILSIKCTGIFSSSNTTIFLVKTSLLSGLKQEWKE